MEPQQNTPDTIMRSSGMSVAASSVPTPVAAAMPMPQQRMQPANGGSIPTVAEDNDIIEKEWVAAIQKTLDQYKDDPYLLSKAMTALRQDYLQKRYGKTVEAAK